MSVRDDMRRILDAGAVEAAGVADPVQRDRTSAAGQVAARTVRQLSMLLGNVLTADMVNAGLGPLLAFLASPRWLDWTTWGASPGQRGSERARTARQANQPDDFAEWAQPVGLDGSSDAALRGVPGGGARLAARLYLGAAQTAVAGSPVYQSWAYRTLARASTSFTRPAGGVINQLEGMAETGRVRNPTQAAQAVREAYREELQWLSTLEGAQFTRDASVELIAVEVPGPVPLPFGGLQRPRVDLDAALRVPGRAPVFIPRARLDGHAPSARNEAPVDGAPDDGVPVDDAPGDDTAPVEGAPTKTKKKRPAWVVPVVVTTLTTIGGVIINKWRG